MKIITITFLFFTTFQVNNCDIKSDVFAKTVGVVTDLGKKGVNIVQDVGTKSISVFNVFANECDNDVTLDYRRAIYDFNVRLFKGIAAQNDDHFVTSQYSIWLAMAALAEGSDVGVFKILNLPEKECLRQRYYEVATQLESTAYDVNVTRRRVLAIDDSLKLNKTWVNYVRPLGLIDSRSLPLKNNLKEIKDVDVDETKISYDDAVLLDTLDFKGLWTTSFDDSLTEHNSPFYNDDGKEIGTVNLLRMRKRVKLAYLPIIHAKVLELPVGNGGRYRFLIMINIGNNKLRRTIEMLPTTIIIDIMENLVESMIPLDIAIPKFIMTSQIDARVALENLGFGSWWNNSSAMRHISEPPAKPSIYQRVSVQLSSTGLNSNGPTTLEQLPGIGQLATSLGQAATGLAAVLGRDFIANRPFIYAFVDSKTRTSLFAGAYSVPSRP